MFTPDHLAISVEASLQAGMLLLVTEVDFAYVVGHVCATRVFSFCKTYDHHDFCTRGDLTLTCPFLLRVLQEGGKAYRANAGHDCSHVQRAVQARLRLLSDGVNPFAHVALPRAEYRRCHFAWYRATHYPDVQICSEAEVRPGTKIHNPAAYMAWCRACIRGWFV